MRLHGVLAVMLLALAATVSPFSTALADDFAPPPWRNDPDGGTTVQEWDFKFSDSVRDINDPLPPDGDSGLKRWGPGFGGDPPEAWEDGAWGWIDDGGGDGKIMPLEDAVLHLFIPNTLDDLRAKFLRIQITYSDRNMPPTGAKPSVKSVSSNISTGRRFGLPQDPAAGQHWEDWILNPNPHLEYIDIDVPKFVAIDQLIVDTICTVPEPGSGALLSMGIGVLLLRPRRPLH